MVQIDVPMAFGIGSLFADAAREQLRKGRAEYYFHALLHNNVYQIFFFSWIPVYFLLNYFGWETTHMWWHADAVTAYPYYLPIFIVVFFIAANGGFLLGRKLVLAGRAGLNRGIYFGTVVYSGIWILAQWQRTLKLGSYRAWLAGAAPWFWEDRTFVFMLAFTLVVWSVPLPIYYRRLRAHGRHQD